MNLLRTLAIVFLVYWGVRFLRRLLQRPSPRDPEREARTPAGADLVQDPVCGMYVPRDTALIARARGETHYFCSERCRDVYAGGGKPDA
jgi:uncharacterized protein